MTAQLFFEVGLQVILPLLLTVWLLLAPWHGRLEFILQALATGLVLCALLLVAIWIVPPWWVPYGYILFWIAVLLRRAPLLLRADTPRIGNPLRFGPLGALMLLGAWAAWLSFQALIGRSPPQEMTLVDLAPPLGPGTYLVASGGATAAVNSHFLTLQPQTARQRAYRGQSYAVDLIKLHPWGLRASGWRPADPAAYAIFGESVLAPCDGRVISAEVRLPDNPVPRTDTSRLEGNHVMLDCGEFAVLLAHLRQGSVLIREGDTVTSGQLVGEVGNSGQTGEPHLHIHVQSLAASDQPLLAGEPLLFTIAKDFLVRNQRLRVAGAP